MWVIFHFFVFFVILFPWWTPKFLSHKLKIHFLNHEPNTKSVCDELLWNFIGGTAKQNIYDLKNIELKILLKYLFTSPINNNTLWNVCVNFLFVCGNYFTNRFFRNIDFHVFLMVWNVVPSSETIYLQLSNSSWEIERYPKIKMFSARFLLREVHSSSWYFFRIFQICSKISQTS